MLSYTLCRELWTTQPGGERMYTRMPLKVAIRIASVGLLTSGCSAGGGSGLLSFLGGLAGHHTSGGAGSDGSSSGGGTQTLTGDLGSDGGSGPGVPVVDVPVVTNPEPGSMILFGGGLAAMVAARRRSRRGRNNGRRS